MLSLKYVRLCNYKTILITLLSLLGILEIMNNYETKSSDITPNDATNIEESHQNLSDPKLIYKKDDISNSAKAKILLLAYAR